jgi:aspartate racemase
MMLSAIASVVIQGVQAIILGCTELSMLVGREDSAVPLFDTTTIHARRAAHRALSAT